MESNHVAESHPSPFQWVLLLFIPPTLFLILYLPTLNYEFVWLDKLEIEEGALLLPPGAMASAFTRPLHPVSSGSQASPYYRPLQLLLVNVIYRIAGSEPRNFRTVSLLIGALTMSLFAFFSWLLLKRTGPALLAACIPAVHPASVEPYVWVSAISEGMSVLFIVGSLVTAWLSVHSGNDNRSQLYRVLSLVAFTIALLSKENAIVLPVLLFAMLISQVIWSRTNSVNIPTEAEVRIRGASLLRLHLIIAIVYLFIIRPIVIGGIGGGGAWIGGDPVSHLATALANWPATIGWLFMPLESTTSDVVGVVTSFSDLRAWAGVVLALGSVISWVLFLRRGWTVAAFGLAWIWIAFGPTANLIPMLHARADRYLFLSVFGMALFIVGILPVTLSQLRPQLRKILGITLSLAMVVGLAQRTQARLPDWRSNETLFGSDVAGDSYYREGRFYLAMNFFEQKRYIEAEEHIQMLISSLENFPNRESYINVDDVYELACLNRLAGGAPRKAIKLVEQLMQASVDGAHNQDVQSCLARAWEVTGKYDKAAQILVAVAKSAPKDPDVELCLRLANNYALSGRASDAREWLERAREMSNGSLVIRQTIRRIESRIPGS